MNQEGPTVLVVDGYADTRDLVRMLLEMKGCRVVEAANGQEAVDIVMTIVPSFILMDLEMPVLNGFEATRKILSHPEARRIPIIAFSANCKGERRARAFAAGCLECYEKPVEFTLIDELIGRYASKQ